MSTAEFWAGEFGAAYTARNRVDWRKRIPFWREVIELTGARSVFEFGCNAGWNLSAIRRVENDIQTYGREINEGAAIQAEAAGHQVATVGLITDLNCYDLAFTAGVLIHIAPEQLDATMREIVSVSAQYVLAVEYAADKEEEVIYRGHRGVLWKRPFGKLYQDLGLRLVSEGVAEGFDQCTYWLLERQ